MKSQQISHFSEWIQPPAQFRSSTYYMYIFWWQLCLPTVYNCEKYPAIWSRYLVFLAYRLCLPRAKEDIVLLCSMNFYCCWIFMNVFLMQNFQGIWSFDLVFLNWLKMVIDIWQWVGNHQNRESESKVVNMLLPFFLMIFCLLS